jgi:hypothetical protein
MRVHTSVNAARMSAPRRPGLGGCWESARAEAHAQVFPRVSPEGCTPVIRVHLPPIIFSRRFGAKSRLLD